MRGSTKPSEARPPREARPPPKAAGAVRRPGAEGDPRASRGLQTKARMRLNSMRFNAWRIHSLGRRESVLCTYGIHRTQDTGHTQDICYTWKLGALPLGEGGGAKHSPPGHAWTNHTKNMKKIKISENHHGSSWETQDHSRISLVTPRHHLKHP